MQAISTMEERLLQQTMLLATTLLKIYSFREIWLSLFPSPRSEVHRLCCALLALLPSSFDHFLSKSLLLTILLVSTVSSGTSIFVLSADILNHFVVKDIKFFATNLNLLIHKSLQPNAEVWILNRKGIEIRKTWVCERPLIFVQIKNWYSCFSNWNLIISSLWYFHI